MTIQARFLRSVAYIEQHLLSPLSLPDVAKQAGFSPPYFSRLFRALTGEPFAAYLRRRRMTVAAERLADGARELRLVDLALDCGYDSQEAFTRAFKRTFGRPPGAFRARPVTWSAPFRRPIDAQELAHLRERLTPQPEIRELDAFTVVGVRERIEEDTRDRIPALWGRFRELVSRIPHVASDSGHGLSLNVDETEGSFDYVAGVPVSRVGRLPAGAIAETLPPETYAVFAHRVRSLPLHTELAPTYRWIFGTWLPSSDWEYPVGMDFERYPPGFDASEAKGTIEIWVPVRARR
ncbi:MAG TPA: AraC family transcriptional regulator [Myxococcota bacterium]|nr:AraC family transcriptional regulator [Myxococcota bacterium]